METDSFSTTTAPLYHGFGEVVSSTATIIAALFWAAALPSIALIKTVTDLNHIMRQIRCCVEQ
jgi:hypothetical protein